MADKNVLIINYCNKALQMLQYWYSYVLLDAQDICMI